MYPRKPRPVLTAIVDERFINDVQSLASYGLNDNQLADSLRIDRDAWVIYKKGYPAINNAIRRGQSELMKLALGGLRQKLQEGDLKAILFVIERRGGAEWAKEISSHMASNEPRPDIARTALPANDPVEAARIYRMIMTNEG
jgi:hypothetical protein